MNKKIDLVEEARQLRLQAEDLEKRVRLARGTQRDLKPGTALVQPKRGPYFVGDEGPTEQLMYVVEQALRERPMRFQELLDATGARDNRIKGVIMRLQREGVNVIDIAPEGTGKAIWFIPSAAAAKKIARTATAKR